MNTTNIEKIKQDIISKDIKKETEVFFSNLEKNTSDREAFIRLTNK